jgi:ABC-type amino acid transport substrate-binding protein
MSAGQYSYQQSRIRLAGTVTGMKVFPARGVSFVIVLLIIAGFSVSCGCLSANPPAGAATADSVTLPDAGLRIITEDLPPFSYTGTGGRVTGQSADVVNAILVRLNKTGEIEIQPWDTGYRAALAGPGVALFSTARTGEREHLFKWAGPVASFDYMLYARNGSAIRINSLEGARNAGTIGVVKGDARQAFLEQNNFSRLATCDSDAECLRNLLAGKSDLWLGSTTDADTTARKERIDPGSFTAVYPVRTVALYIAFSNDTPDSVVSAWQGALDTMKRDGTYDAIRKKYGTGGGADNGVIAAGSGADPALAAICDGTDGKLETVLRTYEVMAFTTDVKSQDWQKISPLLRTLETNEPDVLTWYARPDGSYYTVADGLTTANLKSRSYFPVVLNGSESVGTVVVSKATGRNAAIVAVPVKEGSSVTGVLGASVYLDLLTDEFRSEVPSSYVFYAIDREGTYALHSDKGQISRDTATVSQGTSYGDALRQVRAAESGTVTYDDGGIRYNAVFRTSPLTGWKFVVAWPEGGA